MTLQELNALEEAEFQTGPLSLLTQVFDFNLIHHPVGQESQSDIDHVQEQQEITC